MRWYRGGALVGGLLATAALGGCGHSQSEEMAANETTPIATVNVNPPAPAQPSVSANETSERQPVAGHDRDELQLKRQGEYQVPQGTYEQPSGQYLAPRGIYGERGKIVTEGQVVQKQEYGTYTRPQGTFRQPLGVKTQPEGTFYKPFTSAEIDERQPVAGHDVQPSVFFIRDENGKSWQIRDPALIKRVEQKLSEQGCDPGRTDGVADQRFGKALLQCQQKLGVEPTGVIDQATARALGLDWASFRAPTQKFQSQSGASGSLGPAGAEGSAKAPGE